jgi:hypothetical protein
MGQTNSSQIKPFEISDLIPVLTDLLKQNQRSTVFSILELYFPQARTMADFDALGKLSLESDHRQMYLKCAEAAYSIAETTEQLYIARANLYKAYNVMNQPELALFYIGLNLQITPNDFETLTQQAFNIALLGDRATSEAQLEKLAQQYPEHSVAMRNALSGKMLRSGQLADGVIAFMESLKPTSHRFEKQLGMKKWNGVTQPGKTIYIDGEGGIGDEIINIRFFHKLSQRGMRPVLYSSWGEYKGDTVGLFRRNGFEVITSTYTIDTSQVWCPMMSLPGYLNLSESDLWSGPYLTPQRLPKNKLKSKKFKIGIKCSGNPYFAQDEYRKIPLELMLQYLPDTAEIYYIDKEEGHSNLIDLAPKINSWEDTLDFIDQMDCIVSSCTSLVHAAGAIGKTTHVIVPIAEYYIWSTSRRDTTTPWYGDNFQVHKQTKPRDWHEPLYQMSLQVIEQMRTHNG